MITRHFRVLSLVRYVIDTFLLHASITRPLGESGKLKLTGDMTELEFALGIFLTTGSVQGQRNTMRLEMAGDAYKALRAFRSVIFVFCNRALLTRHEIVQNVLVLGQRLTCAPRGDVRFACSYSVAPYHRPLSVATATSDS